MATKVRDCDCGFIDSNDPTESIFSSFLAVNFSSISPSRFDSLFIPASYEVQRDSTHAYTRNFTADQVQLSEAGLDLIVSPASSDSKSVPCAGIFSRSKNKFFYGSYHAHIRVSDVPGTVTAFYNYKNDTSEVDIEFVSGWKEPTLLYTVKPQIYLANKNPDSGTYKRQKYEHTEASSDQGYRQWSFIWLPDIVHFGLDSNYTRSITQNVPTAPGRLALNQWSDGNPSYSMGPPTEDSVVDVSFLWAVYNDTNAEALACKKAAEACIITDGIFQAGATSDSGGDDGSDGGTTSVNSAHLVGPAPGWLFALFFFYWFAWQRF